jgi:hypothetical protein
MAGHQTRHELMSAFVAFWHLDTTSFHSINEAVMTLLPKSVEAKGITDNRPISLIHSICKLFSKVLANRLAPKLDSLVHISQITFIRGRFIQGNFKLIQSSAKLIHARKRPTLLLKIVIAQAFDSVPWPFLLELMEFAGFSRRCRDWTSVLLSSAGTKVLMNGNPGDKICHAHGLRQGDPLSPMLFLLVMELLNALIEKAHCWSFLQSLGTRLPHRASYANDLVLFISTSAQDVP